MRLYSEIDLDHQLSFLPRPEKEHVRNIIETIAYEYSEVINRIRNCQNCKNSCGNNCKLGSKNYFCNYDKWECR